MNDREFPVQMEENAKGFPTKLYSVGFKMYDIVQRKTFIVNDHIYISRQDPTGWHYIDAKDQLHSAANCITVEQYVDRINRSTYMDEYQRQAETTATYPNVGDNLVYPSLKLAGEAGEVAEKIGKLIRDQNYEPGQQYSFAPDQRLSIAKELGDVLWYVAMLARECGYKLSEIAEINIDKLQDRKERGVLGGSGDNR